MNHRITRVAWLGFALLAAWTAASSAALAQSLYIGDENTAQVVRYDIHTGANQGPFTTGHDFSDFGGLAFDQGGSLYTNDFGAAQIAQFDANTGVYQRTFTPYAEGIGLAVGTDGVLYTADTASINGQPFRGYVWGYDPETGFPTIACEGEAANSDFYDVVFGHDHNFYVTDNLRQQVFSFDGVTGAARGQFTSGGDLQNPSGLTFGPDGNLYVASQTNHQILRYHGTTGAYLGVFASGPELDFPFFVLFGPDGNLYVADFGSNQISRFNGATGAYDLFAPGVVGPIAFAPLHWSGVLPPIHADGSSSFHLGATVPVKFQLTGADSSITTLAARLSVARMSGGAVGPEQAAVATSNASIGNRFRYAGGQYIFNLSTSGLSAGSWRLRIDMGDGVERTFLISLHG